MATLSAHDRRRKFIFRSWIRQHAPTSDGDDARKRVRIPCLPAVPHLPVRGVDRQGCLPGAPGHGDERDTSRIGLSERPCPEPSQPAGVTKSSGIKPEGWYR